VHRTCKKDANAQLKRRAVEIPRGTTSVAKQMTSPCQGRQPTLTFCASLSWLPLPSFASSRSRQCSARATWNLTPCIDTTKAISALSILHGEMPWPRHWLDQLPNALHVASGVGAVIHAASKAAAGPSHMHHVRRAEAEVSHHSQARSALSPAWRCPDKQ
jgi:hypothetical protein